MGNDEKSPELEQDENKTQEEETKEETQEESSDQKESTFKEDDKDWKSEALKYKAILDRNKNKPEVKSSKKSDDLDYAQKAFLTANGIKGSKEFDFVKDELKKSGEELDNLLDNDYFKSRLEKFRNLNKTAEATPKGGKRSSMTTDSVEYWMSKPIEEVPQEMRIKVVNARLKKEESKGKFYNQK